MAQGVEHPGKAPAVAAVVLAAIVLVYLFAG